MSDIVCTLPFDCSHTVVLIMRCFGTAWAHDIRLYELLHKVQQHLGGLGAASPEFYNLPGWF